MATTQGYSPQSTPPTKDLLSLGKWCYQQFGFLAKFLNGMAFLQLTTLYVAPERPREGMVVLADGTHWNPGAGAGFYGYYGSSWVKLG